MHAYYLGNLKIEEVENGFMAIEDVEHNLVAKRWVFETSEKLGEFVARYYKGKLNHEPDHFYDELEARK